MKVDGNTFKDLGYSGEEIGRCLEHYNSLIDLAAEAKQIGLNFRITTRQELIDVVIKDIGPPFKKLERSYENNFPVKMAITPQTEDEQIHADQCKKGLEELVSLPVVQSGAMMPDACVSSSGDASICVGGAIAVQSAIIPAAHSADVCCSMYMTFFEDDRPIKNLMQILKSCTRFGPGGRKKQDHIHHPVLDTHLWNTNEFLKDLKPFAEKHLADQGDGNHFAYVGEMYISISLVAILAKKDPSLVDLIRYIGKTLKVLVTHHGSRGLGAQVYKRGLRAAVKHTNKVANNIPKNGAWLDYNTFQGRDYWDALQYIAQWTEANHSLIHSQFHEKIGTDVDLRECHIHNQHNFVWKRGDVFYHGKGATPAWDNQIGIIPLNMGAPILIVEGLGNKDYLEFAPHGAGRHVSRTQLKKDIGIDDGDQAQEQKYVDDATKGLEVIWYQGLPDISETPIAYKDYQTIIDEINHFNLANVIGEVTPLGSIMAGEDPNPPVWMKRKHR